MDYPRMDRWHEEPTPHLGGVGIFLAFLFAFLITGSFRQVPPSIFIGSGFAFILGLIDDLWGISPPTKLVGLFLAAFILVFTGSVTAFFPIRFANIIISFIWLVGIANALNLLDNMDGLAGGTVLIVSAFLAYFFWKADNEVFMLLSIAVGGATLGFWIFNCPPASIFMGDSGSLFLGLTLANLSIAREPQASNVFAVIGIPTLIFLLPIIDTMMVSITRLLSGKSPIRGGRDHTSHRLVALGLNERQTLLILLGVAVVSGVSAVLLEEFSYSLSLVLIPLVVLGFGLFSAYLGRLKVVEVKRSERPGWKVLTNWVVDLTYRRRVLEVLLDFFLIIFTFYIAYVARLGIPLAAGQTARFLETLPVVVAASYFAFFVLGVYRGVWQYVSIADGFRFIKASTGAAVLALGLVGLIFGFKYYSFNIFFIYAMTLMMALIASRFSFRILDKTINTTWKKKDIPVLIYGAGDGGELALRECERNQNLGYHPVGFIDDDPLKKNRDIHGLRVLGGVDVLELVIQERAIRGVIISSTEVMGGENENIIREVCQRNDVWVRYLRLDFVPLESNRGRS
jgi:UDP-GlcNAc:undecaprenyl-phosphate GlcNAc-1-phosphate transferase